MTPASITVTDGSKRYLQELAAEHGGTVERAGFQRWKWTLTREVSDERGERLLNYVRENFDATAEWETGE